MKRRMKLMDGDINTKKEQNLGPREIITWLKENPNFFQEYFCELGEIISSTPQSEERIADIRDYILKRLRAEITKRQIREDRLIQAAKDYSIIQDRILKASLMILKADSYESFSNIFTEKLPKIFCVEVTKLWFNELPKLFRGPQRIILCANLSQNIEVFDSLKTSVKSCAFLSLDLGKDHGPCFMAIGSVSPTTFHPKQGTELLNFFADVLEDCLSKWLNSVNR